MIERWIDSRPPWLRNTIYSLLMAYVLGGAVCGLIAFHHMGAF